MKNMQYLLSHIKSAPYFKRFEKNIYFDMIKQALPMVMQKYLYYMYIKNNTLIFIFEHPGLQIEFNHKKDFIKSCIKKIEELNNISLDILNIEGKFSIKLFERKEKIEKKIHKIYVYKERSTGYFSNNLKDKDLFFRLESIKNKINKERIK
jgi:hypothetical protein